MFSRNFFCDFDLKSAFNSEIGFNEFNRQNNNFLSVVTFILQAFQKIHCLYWVKHSFYCSNHKVVP